MAATITILETITMEDYLLVFPQDSAVEEDIIQGAINNANITLDSICGGMISKVWGVTETTDPLYRTAEEHNYIKQAVAKQAQYLVSKNLDMSAGSESYTSGSNSWNETRPRPELVVDETIYQLLAQARVYNPNITTDTTITGKSLNSGDFYDPTYDPGNEYITYNVGDNRYILKHTNNTDKFLHTDDNGNVDYVDITLSPTGTSSAIANFITINGVEWALGGGAGSGYWGNIQGTITDQTDLVEYITTRLNGYATEQWVLDNYYKKSETYSQSEVNDLVGTSGGTYLGTTQGSISDVSTDEAASKFIGDYLGVSTEITKNSYFNITIATNDVWNEDIYRYIATGNKIDIGGTQYYEYKFGFKFTGDLSLLKQQVETNTTNIATNTQNIATLDSNTIKKESNGLQTIKNTKAENEGNVLALQNASNYQNSTQLLFYNQNGYQGELSYTSDKIPKIYKNNSMGEIATTSDLDSYLPLTGGKITGDLLVTNSIQIGDGTENTKGLEVKSTNLSYLDLGMSDSDYKFRILCEGGVPRTSFYQDGDAGRIIVPHNTDSEDKTLATIDQVVCPDYATKTQIAEGTSEVSWTATENCYISVGTASGATYGGLVINNYIVLSIKASMEQSQLYFVKTGDVIVGFASSEAYVQLIKYSTRAI